MDDMHAFERLVATEVQVEAGPSRPTDVAAVIRTAATKSPKWRYQSMSSATKLVAAGAVVASFGAFLVSGGLTPTTPTETYPAAASSDSVDAAFREGNEFAGKLSFIEADAHSGPLGVTRNRYRVDEMSDPRLDGEYVLAYTTSIVDFGANWEPLYHASFRIENDEGAWQEEPNLTLEYPDGSASTRTSALVGEGAYAGMTAIAEITYIPAGRFEVRGLIIDDPVPSAPEHTTVDS